MRLTLKGWGLHYPSPLIAADVGTAYELGFMAARGKAVFAYTNDARPHFSRVEADHLVMKMPDGHARAWRTKTGQR